MAPNPFSRVVLPDSSSDGELASAGDEPEEWRAALEWLEHTCPPPSDEGAVPPISTPAGHGTGPLQESKAPPAHDGQIVGMEPSHGWFPHGVAQAGGAYWDKAVLSDTNVSSFLAWTQGAEKQEVEAVLLEIFMVLHRGPHQVMDEVSGASSSPGTQHGPIQVRSCDRPGCHRCGRLRGYSFQWVSDRWTPRLAVLRAEAWGQGPPVPDQARRIVHTTMWPEGLLRSGGDV